MHIRKARRHIGTTGDSLTLWGTASIVAPIAAVVSRHGAAEPLLAMESMLIAAGPIPPKLWASMDLRDALVSAIAAGDDRTDDGSCLHISVSIATYAPHAPQAASLVQQARDGGHVRGEIVLATLHGPCSGDVIMIDRTVSILRRMAEPVLAPDE